MARQGSLCRHTSRFALISRAILHYCALIFIGIVLTNGDMPSAIAQDASGAQPESLQAENASTAKITPPASQGEPLDLNLQLDWAAETLQRWHVEVEVIDPNGTATISELHNLCSDPTTCGMMHRSDTGSAWHFHSSVAMSSGGAAFHVNAAKTAEIVVTMKASAANPTAQSESLESSAAAETPAPSVTRIPITQLLLDSKTSGSEPQWTLKRVTDDLLRVWIDPSEGVSPSGMICEPSTEMSLYVRGNSVQLPAEGELRLHSSMIRVADNQVVATKTSPISLDTNGNSEPILFNQVAPAEPGVYEVRFELEHNQNPLWSRWRRPNEPIARANHVFTVLPERTSLNGDIDFESWHTVAKIKPTDGSQWTVPTFFSARNNPLIPTSLIKQDRPHSNSIDAGQKITIVPGGKTFESNLTKLRVGHPHAITVRYPANRAIQVRMELTNDTNKNIAPAHYVLVDEKRAADRYRDDPNQWRSQSFLYYPSGNDQLRLTNLDLEQDAAIESIEIKAGPLNFAARPSTNVDFERQRARLA